MITYKKTDVVVQLFILIATAVLLFGDDPFMGIYGLVLLGAFQVISALVHFFIKPVFWKSLKRKIYYALCVTSLLILFFSGNNAIFDDELQVLGYMIVVTAGVAIYYIIICISEIKSLGKQ